MPIVTTDRGSFIIQTAIKNTPLKEYLEDYGINVNSDLPNMYTILDNAYISAYVPGTKGTVNVNLKNGNYFKLEWETYQSYKEYRIYYMFKGDREWFNISMTPYAKTSYTCTLNNASFSPTELLYDYVYDKNETVVSIYPNPPSSSMLNVDYNWFTFFEGSIKEPFGEDSKEEGGNGEYDDSSGAVDFPNLPTVSALSTGLVKMYNPTIEELKQIGSFLWTTDFAVNLTKLFADPMESLISLNLFPISPVISENKVPIRFGNINAVTGGETPAPITANPLISQFVRFDCGQINLKEYWGSALDYSPYTKAEIYLPFISTQTIDIDDIMNSTLSLVYYIDLLSGCCTALLKVTKEIDGTSLDSVLYSWGGNMATQVPLFATDYTQKINSLINATVGVGITALSGGSGMAIASGVVGGAMNISGAKPHIQKGSALSMSTGALANFTPYIILTRPIQSKPENYQNYVGWTSNITKTIGDLKGFTQMEYVHIENLRTATSEEKDEIERLLKSGVIL